MTHSIITERRVLGMFFETLQQAQGAGWVEPLCGTPMTSDQDSEEYPWLGMVPSLGEKTGPKSFQQLRTTSWIVRNKQYQGGIRIPKNHIQYDKTGQVRRRVSELALRAEAHWPKILAPLIVAGESTVCYDGSYFFDTTHSEGDSGSQSNDISVDISELPVSAHGSTTAPSASEMVHAIMTAVEQILGYKDDQGEYVNELANEFLVLVPHTLMTEAVSALRARAIDGGDTNVLIEQDTFRFRVQATPRLSSWTTKFAVFTLGGQQTPFIRQQRVPNQENMATPDGLEFTTLWLDSEYCALNDECLFGVETERAVTYGDWKKACLVTLT